MFNPLNYPFLILAVSLPAFWIFAWTGASFRKIQQQEDNRDDFLFVLGGTLTLLGLIIGFTFSMAVSRYDQRKTYEEQEANAIDTEYLRADFLPTADAAEVRALLKSYLAQRILDYQSRDARQLREPDVRTTRLQTEMWSAVEAPAAAQPTPVQSLVVSGMNDVLTSQENTQAAWRNRIPPEAWALLITIAIFCNLLLGYSAHRRTAFLFVVLPIALSVSLFLIADIDSPHGGFIEVQPQNLESLLESLHSR